MDFGVNQLIHQSDEAFASQALKFLLQSACFRVPFRAVHPHRTRSPHHPADTNHCLIDFKPDHFVHFDELNASLKEIFISWNHGKSCLIRRRALPCL
jgi:hypothetical protein